MLEAASDSGPLPSCRKTAAVSRMWKDAVRGQVEPRVLHIGSGKLNLNCFLGHSRTLRPEVQVPSQPHAHDKSPNLQGVRQPSIQFGVSGRISCLGVLSEGQP